MEVGGDLLTFFLREHLVELLGVRYQCARHCEGNMTFAILVHTLFVSMSRFINPSGETEAERGENMVRAMSIGAGAPAWFLWFLRNAHQFGQPAPEDGSTPTYIVQPSRSLMSLR